MLNSRVKKRGLFLAVLSVVFILTSLFITGSVYAIVGDFCRSDASCGAANEICDPKTESCVQTLSLGDVCENTDKCPRDAVCGADSLTGTKKCLSSCTDNDGCDSGQLCISELCQTYAQDGSHCSSSSQCGLDSYCAMNSDLTDTVCTSGCESSQDCGGIGQFCGTDGQCGLINEYESCTSLSQCSKYIERYFEGERFMRLWCTFDPVTFDDSCIRECTGDTDCVSGQVCDVGGKCIRER